MKRPTKTSKKANPYTTRTGRSCASSAREAKAHGSRRAKAKEKVSSTEFATTAAKQDTQVVIAGRREREKETRREKEETTEKEDTEDLVASGTRATTPTEAKAKDTEENSFESTAFAPQPQTVKSHPEYGNKLMTTSWNGYGGNFGGLNLCCMDQKCSKTVTFEGDMAPPPPKPIPMDRQKAAAKAKMTMRFKDYSLKNPFQALMNDDDDIEYGDVKPMGCTIGEIINIAKTSNRNKKTKLHQKHDQKSAASGKPLNKKDILGCLMSQAPEVAGPNLCTNVHDDYEKIEVMVDSGASETVASQDKFTSYPLEETTASGTTYSSAAEKQAEDIVNLGQKYVQVVDENGSESWAKFQIGRAHV